MEDNGIISFGELLPQLPLPLLRSSLWQTRHLGSVAQRGRETGGWGETQAWTLGAYLCKGNSMGYQENGEVQDSGKAFRNTGSPRSSENDSH